MTDDPGERQDLTALRLDDDPVRTNALVAGIVARARTVPQRDGDVVLLYGMRRSLAAAAAALVAIAAAVVIMTPRDAVDAPASQLLASWATAQHVPTNGELLALFQGYAP